jgi:DNA-binding protein YbaB
MVLEVWAVADPGFAGERYDGFEWFERMARQAEPGMHKVAEMRQRINDIVGRAAAADGRITAEFTSAGGLSALDLDPRVLRLPSRQLSQEIRTAVNAAAKDFQSRLTEAGGELFGMTGGSLAPNGPAAAERFQDPAAAMAQVEKIGNEFAGQMRDLLQELIVQQRRTREAAERPRNL